GSHARASYRRIVTSAVREIAARHGLNRPGSPRDAGRRTPTDTDGQLHLDLPTTDRTGAHSPA
ncbi:MAG TPA: hypothetical protein K8V84_23945, partial [Nocardiopsis listeri]|nr:hypothetical protein [Nocardiopsis listeri]